MGKMRSRDGCLTCKRRHVKCDETKPICEKCAKGQRTCLQDTQPAELKIQRYRPHQDVHDGKKKFNGRGSGQDVHSPRRPETNARTYDSALHAGLSPEVSTANNPTFSSGRSPNTTASSLTSPPQSFERVSPGHEDAGVSPSVASIEPMLSRPDAHLLVHFVEHLGRWLDCTDASRQFTLNIPSLAKTCPTLLHAVTSFAARHLGDSDSADLAQENCIELLIPLLSSDNVADNEAILCAIVILRVCEQLSGKTMLSQFASLHGRTTLTKPPCSATVTGSDQERHLAGFNALLKTSQGRQVDPSIPTLSQAAFWVYVRQCLYNACVNQQPPNLDFDLTILPPPLVHGPTVDVKTETAWANTITWICATVVHFCFDAAIPMPDPLDKMRRWQELSNSVETWHRTKPSTFDPIWQGTAHPDENNPFPEIWFSADWHVMAFGFYHLACLLLAVYKPAPRFAVGSSIRRTLPETDQAVMSHARALCGACQSSLATVPSLITLCHSVFIWGPLMTDDSERRCVVDMLRYLEVKHAWPTLWIIEALENEWRF